jgi:hypothetical protein
MELSSQISVRKGYEPLIEKDIRPPLCFRSARVSTRPSGFYVSIDSPRFIGVSSRFGIDTHTLRGKFSPAPVNPIVTYECQSFEVRPSRKRVYEHRVQLRTAIFVFSCLSAFLAEYGNARAVTVLSGTNQCERR